MLLLLTLWACKGAAPPDDEVVGDDSPADDSPADDSPADDSPAPMPDLSLREPIKSGDSIVIPYCNEGEAGGTISVSVRLMNVDTTAAWERGGNPFPAPGECVEARAAPCADIGLDCGQTVTVEAVIDPYDAVRESDEADNRGTFRL